MHLVHFKFSVSVAFSAGVFDEDAAEQNWKDRDRFGVKFATSATEVAQPANMIFWESVDSIIYRTHSLFALDTCQYFVCRIYQRNTLWLEP